MTTRPRDWEYYGEERAAEYDAANEPFLDTGSAVELLAGEATEAGGGRVLELGVGTGRLAIPLAARGLEVHGVDASEAMLARLRAKPGGDRVRVVKGDMVAAPVEGRFAVVVVAFNTLFALPTQDEQLACFRKAASLLEPEGRLLVETFVFDASKLTRGEAIRSESFDDEKVTLEIMSHDRLNQRADFCRVELSTSGVKLRPGSFRYAYPSELDLMGQLAGLRLRDRWSSWSRRAFTGASNHQISVYVVADGR